MKPIWRNYPFGNIDRRLWDNGTNVEVTAMGCLRKNQFINLIFSHHLHADNPSTQRFIGKWQNVWTPRQQCEAIKCFSFPMQNDLKANQIFYIQIQLQFIYLAPNMNISSAWISFRNRATEMGNCFYHFACWINITGGREPDQPWCLEDNLFVAEKILRGLSLPPSDKAPCSAMNMRWDEINISRRSFQQGLDWIWCVSCLLPKILTDVYFRMERKIKM